MDVTHQFITNVLGRGAAQRSARRRRRIAASVFAAAAAGILLACASQRGAVAQGTWSTTTAAPEPLGTAILLTNGTVIVHDPVNYKNWFKLTPDVHGNYADGKWTRIASNHVGREYGQTAVLRDGRFFFGGGEYLSPGETDHNTCEVYDPASNSWTLEPDSLYSALGDTGSAILPDGLLLCSNWSNADTDIFNETTSSWTNASPMSTSTGDEETWNSLPDGSVLSTYEIGQRYIESENTWIPTASLPDTLVDSVGEIGPGLLLYNGTVFVIGATGQSAIFTPPTSLNGAGSWTAGPDMPSGLGGPDTPGCVEVDGNVLCVGAATDYSSVGVFLEYDPANNTYSQIATPPGDDSVSYANRMLQLPNGQVLVTAGYDFGWLYTPSSGPQSSWAPAVSTVTRDGDGSYTVAGTQLNGLTNGGAYGDEANPYTHYPLVYLVDSAGVVHYAKTYNFSQMNPSAPGASQTALFTVPAVNDGVYQLHVVASGVSSAAYAFDLTTQPPKVTGLSPTTGPVGTIVRISGFNFATTSSVQFGSVSASFGVNKAGTIVTAKVPSAAVTAPATVTTAYGSATSKSVFTVNQAPLVSSFSPLSGPVGTLITAIGVNFSSVTAVSFPGASATKFTPNSAGTVLRIVVPAGATSGAFTVTNPQGSSTSKRSFTVTVAS